jgi:hypothetical protein
MSPHTVDHIYQAAGVLSFGAVLTWIAYHLLREDPKDVAQRELDRKKRR